MSEAFKKQTSLKSDSQWRQHLFTLHSLLFIDSSWLILLLALALRLWALDVKPPHFDEGINGWFADQVRERGFYAYDPTNYHGPLYFYLLFVVQTLFGRSLWVLRMPSVIASVATVWLALRFDRFLGKSAARWGASILAVSPAMIFYGRYAIHESWVVASLMIVMLGLFGLWSCGERRSLFITVIGITLLLLLKETAVIHLVAFVLAAGCLYLWQKIIPSTSQRGQFRYSDILGSDSTLYEVAPKYRYNGTDPFAAKQLWSWRDFFWSLLIAFAVLFFFYSGGLLNVSGFYNLFRTLPAWIHTGTGSGGHVKEEYQWWWLNYYWLALMVRYEIPSLLGMGFALWSLWRGSAVARYLAIYALGVFVAYSIIPYKTPWCLISILWPFALLFGIFISQLPWKKSATLAGALLLAFSLCLALRLNYWHYADFEEPYVYVQTSPEISRLTEPMLTLACRDPRNYQLTGQILLESYYPLPWIWGDFTSISYFGKERAPKNYDGAVIVIEVSRCKQVEERLREPYYREEFELRDAMEKCVAYFKKKTFQPFFEDPHVREKKLPVKEILSEEKN